MREDLEACLGLALGLVGGVPPSLQDASPSVAQFLSRGFVNRLGVSRKLVADL